MSQTPNEPTVSISLTVKNAADALDFYTKAFGAEEVFRMPLPDGTVVHAEFMLGDTLIYISNEAADWQAFAMEEGSTASCLFALTKENCDEAFAQATEAGAIPINKPEDQFWGFRTSLVKDPFGYRWNLRQKIEDLSPEEMAKRAAEFMAAAQG